jgi:hypothetical protein
MLIVIVNSSSRLVFLLKLFVRQIISVDLDDYKTHFVNSELEKLISTVLSATNFGKLVPEMVKRSPPRTLISVSGIMVVTVQSTLILGTLGSVGIKP